MTTPERRSPSEDPRGERLQKVLASAGYGSRRACEELMLTGRVTVDGKTASELGVRVDLDQQKVTVDGERIKPQPKRYYLLNKPRHCLCTNDDPGGRVRVVDLLPPSDTRLFTVGRLDENTEGLLLVTNDGELAHRLAHPRFQVERVYRVQVAGIPTGEAMREMEQGIHFTEGKFRVRQVRKLKTKGQSTLLEVVLTEGQNREVRRLFARIGHKVMALMRVAFGPLKLGSLPNAEYRILKPDELKELQAYVRGGGRKRRTDAARTARDQRRATSKPTGSKPAARKPAERSRPVKAKTGESPQIRAATKRARPAGKRVTPQRRPSRG